MATATYPYDSTGVEATNLIPDELHSVQPPDEISQASIIIPRAAPFFINKLVIRTEKNGKGTLLVEGKDYFVIYEFVAGSNVTGKPLAGGILFTNALYTGNVYVTYQTLGGDFVVNDTAVLENLTRKYYADIRAVRWDQLEGVPSAFPPNAHLHPVEQIITFEDIGIEMKAIAAALLGGGSEGGSSDAALALIRQHIAATSGAHTPAAIGLGQVANYAVATEAETLALSPNTYITPALVSYLFRRMIQDENMDGIRDDVTAIDKRVTVLETSVKQITMVVNSLGNDIDEINNSINLYRLEIANLAAQTDDVKEVANQAMGIASQALAQSVATEANLEIIMEDVNRVLYDGNIILPVGSHLITLASNASMLISAVGAGGGSGKWYPTSAATAQMGGGPTAGEDTVVYFLGSSSQVIEPLPVLIAGGGQGGVSSYAEIGAISAGQAGTCKRLLDDHVTVTALHEVDPTVDYVTGPKDTAGVAGAAGDTAATQSAVAGVGGWGVDASGNGKIRTYGKGRNSVTKAGGGGSGGRWQITIQNDTPEPVRLSVYVGRAGLSARATVNDEVEDNTPMSSSNGVVVMTYVA